MSKHTPGPWRIDREAPDSICTSGFKTALRTAEIPAIIVQSFGTTFALGVDVAAVPTYGELVPAEANARLIASAPDMLEALRRIAYEPQGRSDAAPGHVLAAVEEIARAAIAKAEGWD